MNRMRAAQARLKTRLRGSAGRVGEIWRGGTRLYADVQFVPTSYTKIVRTMEDTATDVKIHVWLIGLDEVPVEPERGDEFRIEGETYRVVRDDITETFWQPHGPSEEQRAVFTHRWSD